MRPQWLIGIRLLSIGLVVALSIWACSTPTTSNEPHGHHMSDAGKQPPDTTKNTPDATKNTPDTTGKPGDCGLGKDASTWQAIQKLIIEKSQCVTCHNKSSKNGLDLQADVAYKNLIKIPSKRQLKEPMDLIFPGQQKLSMLYLKLAAKTLGEALPEGAGEPMPISGDAISKEHLEALRLWIRAGAPEKGVVEGTAKLLKCGLSKDFIPNKIPPLQPPKEGEGVQFIAGPWLVKAGTEDEVCFATYYDLTKNPKAVPDWAKVPCSGRAGTKDQTCIAYNYDLLVQDPQSHHSINRIYAGKAGPGDNAWGAWSCRGGPMAGTACDPTKMGVSAKQGGAECGERGVCGTRTQSSPVCAGFGPSDLRGKSLNLNGSQEPVSLTTYGKGVYAMMPMKGFIIWNSHGFNLSKKDSDLEQYINVKFAKKEDRKYLRQRIFHSRHIFAMNVPPFEKQELCATYTLPRYARLTGLSSHVHKRGSLFRIWAPPHEPGCKPPTCKPPTSGKPVYTSSIYDDPVTITYEKPLEFDHSDAKDRTYKYCGVFDNGFADRSTVKRRSKSKGFANCSAAQTMCIGGPNHKKSCSENSACDSKKGAGDGDCDACPLKGGLTTEDEMFILLGNYYLAK